MYRLNISKMKSIPATRILFKIVHKYLKDNSQRSIRLRVSQKDFELSYKALQKVKVESKDEEFNFIAKLVFKGGFLTVMLPHSVVDNIDKNNLTFTRWGVFKSKYSSIIYTELVRRPKKYFRLSKDGLNEFLGLSSSYEGSNLNNLLGRIEEDISRVEMSFRIERLYKKNESGVRAIWRYTITI